jgi:hypothetical protein
MDALNRGISIDYVDIFGSLFAGARNGLHASP